MAGRTLKVDRSLAEARATRADPDSAKEHQRRVHLDLGRLVTLDVLDVQITQTQHRCVINDLLLQPLFAELGMILQRDPAGSQ